jgi:hypothetical protein
MEHVVFLAGWSSFVAFRTFRHDVSVRNSRHKRSFISFMVGIVVERVEV